MALSRWTGVHIHRWCRGRVFSHDLFFLANGKEKCASMINGHDYLVRKCGFLAQQLHFYDLNLGRDASSCRQSCLQTSQTVCVLWRPNISLLKCLPSAVWIGRCGLLCGRLRWRLTSILVSVADAKFQSCRVLVGVYENRLIVLQIGVSKSTRAGKRSEVKMLRKSPWSESRVAVFIS